LRERRDRWNEMRDAWHGSNRSLCEAVTLVGAARSSSTVSKSCAGRSSLQPAVRLEIAGMSQLKNVASMPLQKWQTGI
jgi:hypothetical protein